MSTPSWSNVSNAWVLALFGGYMYVSNWDAETISKIDASTGSVVNASWATGISSCSGIVIDAAGTYMYATNGGSGTISKINVSDGSIVNASWASGLSNPQGLVIDAAGTYMYVMNNSLTNVSKINMSDGSIVNFSWAAPPSLSGVGIAIDSTETYMYLACYNGFIVKINMSDGSIVNASWVSGLNGPQYLIIDDEGTYMYVSNYDDNNISQIRISDGTIVNPSFVSGLSGPADILINNNYIYVANYNDGSIGKYLLASSPVPCFKKDSKILTHNGYRLIQDLKKGDLVKTLKNGYKKIDTIITTTLYHAAVQERVKDQLYKCSKSEYPDLFEPLVITGNHSILVDEFSNEEQRQKTIEMLGKVYVTDTKYRLPACVDPRASVYETEGIYNVYHLALENNISYMNYAIYANGLLVETCSTKILNEFTRANIQNTHKGFLLNSTKKVCGPHMSYKKNVPVE